MVGLAFLIAVIAAVFWWGWPNIANQLDREVSKWLGERTGMMRDERLRLLQKAEHIQTKRSN